MKSKVKRIIREHGLTKMEEQLVICWTDDGDKQRSLRELADYFNKELLRTAMDSAGMSTLNGEVTNTYGLLTADDVSSGDRIQTETNLDRNGIDVHRLRQEFVSHQAIHTYLTKHRGVQHQTENSERDRLESTENTIQRLRSRLVAVAENRLRSLSDAEMITLGTFSVLVDVRVVCEDCGTHTDVSTLLNERGCECDRKR